MATDSSEEYWQARHREQALFQAQLVAARAGQTDECRRLIDEWVRAQDRVRQLAGDNGLPRYPLNY